MTSVSVSTSSQDVTHAVRSFLLKMKRDHHQTRLKGSCERYNNKSIGSNMKRTTVTTPGSVVPVMTPKKLQALTKQELMEMCRERNMNCYGTKFDMVQRLLSSEKKGILQEIKHSIPAIRLYKDTASNVFVHPETGLVFDPNERKVVGRRDDGKIVGLTYKDIQTCLRYKFRYVLPTNLAESQFPKTTLDKSGDDSGRSSVTLNEDDRLKERLADIERGVTDAKSPSSHDQDDDEEEEEDNDA